MMKSWLQQWIISVGIAEFIGIGVATLGFIACNSIFGEPVALPQKALVLLIIIIAGATEGWLVGHFQAKRLAERLPTINTRAWIRRTTILAASAWFLGMLPSTFIFTDAAPSDAAAPDFPIWITLVLAVFMGLIFGTVFGWVQMPVLKPLLGARSKKWILANAIAWAAGLWWVFLAAALPNGTEPFALIIAGGVFSGLLMGLTVGLVTGLFLERMLGSA